MFLFRKAFKLKSICLAVGVLTQVASLSLAPDPTPQSRTWAQVTYIADGDTKDVDLGRTVYWVRHIGMNTAERGEPCQSEHEEGHRELAKGTATGSTWTGNAAKSPA